MDIENQRGDVAANEKKERTNKAIGALCGNRSAIQGLFQVLNDESNFEHKLEEILSIIGSWPVKDFEEISKIFECTTAYFPEHYKEIAKAFTEPRLYGNGSLELESRPEFILGTVLGIFRSVITIVLHNSKYYRGREFIDYQMVAPSMIAGFLSGRWGEDLKIAPSYENALSKTVKDFIEECVRTEDGKVILSTIFRYHLSNKYQGRTTETDLSKLLFGQLANKLQNSQKADQGICAKIITGTYKM